MGDETQVIGKIDVQLLLQNLSESQRGILEERRNSARAIGEERERTRTQLERLKKDHEEKIRSIEKENEALARALGRAQGEIDNLRLDNAILKSAAIKPVPPAVEKAPEATMAPGAMGLQGSTLGMPPQLPKVTIVPPPGPTLGKSVPIRPEGGDTV